MPKNKKCIDCEKLISKKAIRCRSCSKSKKYNSMYNKTHKLSTRIIMKEKSSGINNSSYKHGKYCNNNYCTNCNKKISSLAKRCKLCEKQNKKGIKNPEHSKRMIGKNHPNYIDGRSLQRNYCMDCNKLLGENSFYYNHKRCGSCAKKIEFKNPKRNPGYIDGRSYELYPQQFNDELKNKIRQRDNYICQNCNIQQSHYKRKLDIHHIDYNKINCTEKNLITLCNQCNVKANHNRNYWTKFYKFLIKEKYDKLLQIL